MEASESQPVEAPEAPAPSPAAAAAAAITGSRLAAQITTPPGDLPDDAPPVKFDRLSVERRVLGTVNDDLYTEQLGSRNNLASIADFLLTDPHTTHCQPPNERLNVEGLTVEQAVGLVLEKLENCVQAGLLERRGDVNDPAHTYHLTEAGCAELSS